MPLAPKILATDTILHLASTYKYALPPGTDGEVVLEQVLLLTLSVQIGSNH